MRQILLVSQSPRRKNLLERAGYFFSTDHVKVSEIIDENLNLPDSIKTIAQDKLQAYLESGKYMKSQDKVIITADTVVVHGEQILGKPRDNIEAAKFLRLLSGETHSVKTAICVYDVNTKSLVRELDSTKVQFHALTDQQISDYIATGEPMDKAGAYAIQGVGRQFVSSYEGSWSNVVGLPMELLETIFEKNNWHVKKR